MAHELAPPPPWYGMRTFRDEGKEPSGRLIDFYLNIMFSFTFFTKHKRSPLNPHLLVNRLFLPESRISGQPDLLTHCWLESQIHSTTELLKIGIVYLGPKIGQRQI